MDKIIYCSSNEGILRSRACRYHTICCLPATNENDNTEKFTLNGSIRSNADNEWGYEYTTEFSSKLQMKNYDPHFPDLEKGCNPCWDSSLHDPDITFANKHHNRVHGIESDSEKVNTSLNMKLTRALTEIWEPNRKPEYQLRIPKPQIPEYEKVGDSVVSALVDEVQRMFRMR